MAETDPLALNITGVSDLVGSNTNKTSDGVLETEEGSAALQEDVLKLDMSDEKLIALADKWEDKYAPYEAKLSLRQKKNKIYYLGRQLEDTSIPVEDAIASNLLFEAEETFLPMALSKNPEPVVYSDNSDEGNKISSDVKTMLQYHADQLVLRRKLTLMTRQWSIYFLGVIKHGWDKKISDISSEVRKIQDFIFDPDGYVDAYGDFIGVLGERITISAEDLIDLFPEHKAEIIVAVDGRLGTDCTYTEWWTDELCFFKFKSIILDKHKNELYKYDLDTNDEYGLPSTEKGKNHFARPKKPYTFLSVFSLGEQPHDVTGLIEQNIPNQNLISDRTLQIAKNIRRSNNSLAFSENNFNQETAKQAATAFEKGNPVIVPPGVSIGEAIVRFPADGFPQAAFTDLENNKQNLRSIFGTLGSTAQPANEDDTVRGKMLNQQYDSSRIGGGIGDALEQVADNIFNWWVQLYYVYYDEEHFAAVMGQMKAVEYVTLSSQNLDRQLIVSVSPDSMKPHDELTEMNQALELWKEGALDPKTLLTILDFPDPQETAAQVVLWKTNPQLYLQLNFPDLAQIIQKQVQEQMALSGGQPPRGGATPPQAPGGEIPPEQPGSTGGIPANDNLNQVPIQKM